MAPFPSRSPALATLPRRGVLAVGLGALVAACSRSEPLTASTTPPLDMARLNKGAAELAERAKPGVLGVALTNLESAESFSFNGGRRFPMFSVFKAPLAAAALAEVDARRLNLDEMVRLEPEDLSPPLSAIAEAFPARRDYSLRELMAAAVVDGDNTAADVLMKRIGGPGTVSAWLSAKRLNDIRIDRYERELAPEAYGMASFRPAWKGAGFRAAYDSVPDATKLAAMRRFLADPRDTATPQGAVDFLMALDRGELLSPASTRMLIQMMRETPRAADRLKAGFPAGVAWAHRPGTSGLDLGISLAFNDIGLFTLPDRRSYAAAAFLSGATLSMEAQAALFADLGRLMIRSVG
ncbi:class A beta-lactamase [Phenylobacterium sp. J367]|uniref:class A beta-lactamase n=1 Tax=Phenylobacterium sp. J367 TaxID=2898435 RepID=UPI0021516ABF|nr:class A beta-lactamase [Phenylobacterium sp. J367]MCR5879132.1 class A beta-lactamase [Phenylobacterium sp. J367]